MISRNEKIEPPSDDKRWRIVQATMQRNGFTLTSERSENYNY
ncbi:MAG TPA: hypothetical protein PKJ56_07695 [Promineifilum sp.]|nr:hypothetical protein [Promineifilum sp.]